MDNLIDQMTDRNEVDVEMAKLPVPHDGDAFLTNIYGNWRQVPKEEEIMKNIHNVKLISK